MRSPHAAGASSRDRRHRSRGRVCWLLTLCSSFVLYSKSGHSLRQKKETQDSAGSAFSCSLDSALWHVCSSPCLVFQLIFPLLLLSCERLLLFPLPSPSNSMKNTGIDGVFLFLHLFFQSWERSFFSYEAWQDAPSKG